MSDMIDARGAVCTYSSNMGQWIFYHTAERRRSGEYALVGLDQPIERFVLWAAWLGFHRTKLVS